MIILAVVFLGGGGLLGCIGCGAGDYFFWPSGNNELLAYVSPDANLIVGGRPKELKTKFAGFKDMFGQAAMQANDPFPEFEDLVLNSEQFLMFANTNNFGFAGPPQQKVGMVMAFKAEQADIDRLRNSKRLGPAKNVGGHSIHKMNAAADGPDFIALLAAMSLCPISTKTSSGPCSIAARNRPPPAAIDLSRSVDRSPMWVAFTFSGEVKNNCAWPSMPRDKRSPPWRRLLRRLKAPKG